MEFSKSHEANQLTQDRNTADSSALPLDGFALVSEVVQHTGIAGTLIEPELSAIIEGAGHSASTLTLEQLRAAMLSYLESMNVGMSEDEESDEPSLSDEEEIFYEGAD
jgi:hypothetical protein